MTRLTYLYDPAKITAYGKDRMRFELGDIMVEGNEQTSALSDEEYNAIINAYPGKWKKAKLALMESIMMRFSYETDEKVGPMSISLRQRYDGWAALYNSLKKEVSAAAVPKGAPMNANKPLYFYEGIHNNAGTESERRGHLDLPKT